MGYPLTLWIALTALPTETAASAAAEPAQEAAAPAMSADRDEFRQSYLAAMRRSARRANPDPAAAVPELVGLYRQLDGVDGLSSAEKARMQRALRGRLGQLRERLQRSTGRAARLAGPADTARARQLIELIQTTIAPESWDVNGGRGSIHYYSPLQVLVVRQTGEVHHELGGVLEQLRR